MTDLALLMCFIMFITVGCLSPFIWSLGYIWVDSMLPQALSYGLLNAVPLALIMALGAFSSYFFMDRRSPPRVSGLLILTAILAGWITLTTTWAVVPNAAWTKWDPSFKTLVFTLFIPFVFRSRVQIEALVLMLLASTAPHLLPWGVKTFLTGGGYGMSLGLLGANSAWIAESSAISAIAAIFIPLLTWTRQHSLILPWRKANTVGTLVLSVLYLIATIGTFARTGIIALGILGIGMLVRSKRKIMFILLAGIMGAVVLSTTTDKWTERIGTIREGGAESSTGTRLLVWQWAWNFAQSHPLGGGFNSFLTNTIIDKAPDGTETVQYGRAFHNVYFSSLGEHGFPGLALYVTILCVTLLTFQGVIRRCRNRPELLWAGDLARSAQLGVVILMACGMFIDISYTFILWDLVALAMCLKAHVARVLVTAPQMQPLPSRIPMGASAMPQFR